MKKIAVLSAGNGGQALAADLALRGHDVTLYDLPRFAPVIEGVAATPLNSRTKSPGQRRSAS